MVVLQASLLLCLLLIQVQIIKAYQQMLREAVVIIILVTWRLTLGSHVVNFVDEFLMLVEVPLHVLFGFLLEVIQLFLGDILPNPAHLFHNIEIGDIGVLFDDLGSRLKILKVFELQL